MDATLATQTPAARSAQAGSASAVPAASPAGPADEGRSPAREEVLAAAARAFMERGYAATSIDDVAALMGATKGRVYHYYRAKLDLFADVVRRSLEVIHAEVRAAAEAAGPDPAARMEAMVRTHVASILRDIPFHRCALQGVEMHLTQAPTPDQRAALRGIIALRDRHQRLFGDTLEAGIAAGAWPACDAKPVLLTLLGALNAAVWWYRPREGETAADRAALIESIAGFALAGLAGTTEPNSATTNGRTP